MTKAIVKCPSCNNRDFNMTLEVDIKKLLRKAKDAVDPKTVNIVCKVCGRASSPSNMGKLKIDIIK